MGDIADWSSSVVVQSGTVTISGTATVQISGTPTVSISGTPTVNVGNTPAVTISSGTVTANISGTPNINIQSQSVNLNTQQPMTALASLSFPANGRTTQTTAAVATGTHAIALENAAIAALTNLVVKGHTTGVQYFPFPANGGASLPAVTLFQSVQLVIPVDSTQDAQFDVSGTNPSASNAVAIRVTQILDTQAVWVQSDQGMPVYVSGLAGVNPPSTLGLLQMPQPYDVTGLSAPAAGSQATVTLAASGSGQAYRCHSLIASIEAGVATAAGTDVELLDGVTIKIQVELGFVATVGAIDRFSAQGLAYLGTVNTSMGFKFANANGSDAQRVNIGAYLL